MKSAAGILIVGFGGATRRSLGLYRSFADKARKAYPDLRTQLAFTSERVRERLAENGETVPGPLEALNRFAADGVSRVAVQPLQVIPGTEFHDLVSLGRTAGVETVMGAPLVGSSKDIPHLAGLLPSLAPRERMPDHALLFMGHGTRHPANAVYVALDWVLAHNDPLIRLGTIDQLPLLKDILPDLEARGVRTVHLMPLMADAGNHAHKDMAGDGPFSWASSVRSAGFTVHAHLKGLLEHESVTRLWLDHLDLAVSTLSP